MPSTVINRTLFTVGAFVFCIVFASAAPHRPNEQVTVVSNLYKAFAWQVLSSSDDIFGKPLAQQESAVLLRYFDRDLAILMIEDHRCATKTGELCNLDFDPIFASQDPGASDLSIRSTANGIVAVEFTYPANGEKVRLEYRLRNGEGGWRISDIRYPGMENASLKHLLMRKVMQSAK